MALKTYRDLEVWQRGMELAEAVYTVTAGFPKAEMYGLTAQIRRAVVSIASNIAEGYGRTHRGDYLRFLSIACGSLAEVETQLILAARLGFTARDDLKPVWELCQRTGMMLAKLRRSLSNAETQSA